MHPEFWLVLARVARPFAIALLGSVPMAILFSMFTTLFGMRGIELAAFAFGLALVPAVLSLPMLLAEELPTAAAESGIAQVLRGAYLLGSPGALLGGLAKLLALGSPLSDMGAVRLMMVFALFVGAPLAGDRFGRFEGVHQRYSPWSLGTRSLFAVGLHLGVFWSLVLVQMAMGESRGGRLTPVSCAGLIGMIAVALWTAGLGKARELVDRAIERLEQNSDEEA